MAPNRLTQDFCADAQNQKRACRIACLGTGEGWLFLAMVPDLHPRMVAGWAMDKRIKAKLFL